MSVKQIMLEKEMFYNVYIFIIFLIFFTLGANASEKDKIIENLRNTENFDFQFEQNINGKIENGICTIEYPRKIYCEYARSNNKILVSDGRYLVVKTRSSYYQYLIKKTPLNLILDKNFLIKKINQLSEKVVNGNLINFTIVENDYEISIFFDNQNYNLVGWQNIDLYQNFNITFISGIRKNRLISQNLFQIPKRN